MINSVLLTIKPNLTHPQWPVTFDVAHEVMQYTMLPVDAVVRNRVCIMVQTSLLREAWQDV